MSLSAADLASIKSTATSKFETSIQNVSEQTYKLFTVQDTFGTEGYVPTMLGGLGAAAEWLNKRVLHRVAEFGIRFVGKVYANGIQEKKEVIRVSPVATAAKYGAMLAKDAAGFGNTKFIDALKNNVPGFDRDAWFGDHTFSDEPDAVVQSNLIAGSGPTWYLLNEESFVEATAEDYHFQTYGGDNTQIDFMEDSLGLGWRAVKIFAPGFWANAVASKATLTSENLNGAITVQSKFKNDKGVRIGAKAKYLVVPRSLSAAAEKLIKAALVEGGNTNTDLGRLTLVVLDDLEA